MSFDQLSIGFSSKEVTPWGGIALLKKMLVSMNFDNEFSHWNFPLQNSNRGYNPKQLIEQFMVSIWCGGSRFVHNESIRFDTALANIFGWNRVAAHKSIVRYFNKFNQENSSFCNSKTYQFINRNISIPTVTLDVDSTVVTRYGEQQEGATKGYNPKKKGRLSHHPLMAFIAESKSVANFWLRDGKASSANNFEEFLNETMIHLGEINVGLLRADSGFFKNKILRYLEAKTINYIISCRMNFSLQNHIADPNNRWWPIAKGIDICEFTYKANNWEKPRRTIAIRQHIKQRTNCYGKSLSLFANDESFKNYKYSSYCTSLTLSSEQVYRLYNQRADCENRIKELKSDFGLDAFNVKSFYATEAALGIAMLAYNLMSLFRQAIMRSKIAHTLSTLHGKVFAIGATWNEKTTPNNTKLQQLILFLPRKKRKWFLSLWNNATEPPKIT